MTGTSPSPPRTSISGEPIDPSVDLVRIAARGLFAGTLAGVGAAGMVLWLVRVLLRNAAPSELPNTGPAFYVLVFGMMAAMGAASLTAWRHLAPISSPFRRGVFAMIAAFATFVGALLATPIHYFLGQPGLIGFSMLCLAGALALGRRRA